MPDRVVVATAPVRICDIGGWTDTWFAVHGAVLSVAVEPLVEVRVQVTTGPPRVLLSVPGLSERYDFDRTAPPGRLPLLEAALAQATIPADVRLDVTVRTGVPPGSGTGTSAAAVVALLGALDRLTPGVTAPREIARVAHRVETEGLGLQSGVQDQLAAACGGVNLLEVRYPDTDVHPVAASAETLTELEGRLVLVWLGHPHRSSAVHDEVIARLGAESGGGIELDALRTCAREAARALEAGNLEAFGGTMRASTEAQRDLHPSLVSAQAQALIEVAAGAGATGWKVNGAGGDGGSLTLLAGSTDAVDTLSGAITSVPGRHEVLPTRLAPHGLAISDST